MRRLAPLALLVAVGCGYHLVGTGPAVPAAARTISIREFGNRTHQPGLEVELRRAVEDEFRRRGPLRVVPEPEGDLSLGGDIRNLQSVPVGFSATTDEALQYQGIITVSVRLVERESGKAVYETKALREAQDFGAVSGVVISSSPHFQRGTIDARDLANMTNVQIGESRRREAMRDLLDILARDIYQQAMEGF
jgi:hypothetical protein